MIKDYHNHTFRCNHAKGDVSDYVEVAARKGLKVFGMSDHTPLPDNRWIDVRMYLVELEEYINAIETAKQKFPQIKVLKALECEYIKEFHNFFKDELLGKYKFDYLITSAHYFPIDGQWVSTWDGASTLKGLKAYADYVIDSMKTGLFAFAAHPDIFGISHDKWSNETTACCRYILEAAQDLKMPLEINGYGFRKPMIKTGDGLRYQYPLERFWEVAAEYDVKVLVNSDAHSPEDVAEGVDRAYDLIKKYNLKIADLSYLEK